jgi:spore germination cell wall hydrolase CwlJ-like protein
MNRIVRAAGFAAAAVAFGAAATFSAPSQAEQTAAVIAAPAAPDLSTGAGVDAALDGAETEVAPSAPIAEEKPGLFRRLWTTATEIFVMPAMPAPQAAKPHRTLDQLVADYTAPAADGREQDCLAKAVYFEARGESLEGQLAVAEVVLNRAASGRYPSDICDVITQPWQFSFITKGRFPTPNFGSDAWLKAVAVAKIAQGKIADTLPSDVLWYHADYVAPSWGKRLTKQSKIGLHIFYS